MVSTCISMVSTCISMVSTCISMVSTCLSMVSTCISMVSTCISITELRCFVSQLLDEYLLVSAKIFCLNANSVNYRNIRKTYKHAFEAVLGLNFRDTEIAVV